MTTADQEQSLDGNGLQPEADREEEREVTLFERCSINIRGWDSENEEDARAFAYGVLDVAREMSRYLDLSRLESIVVAWDYREALASVYRNSSAPPAAPTSNEYGEGAAMAVTVTREDQPWSVVVIWLPLVRQLVDAGHENHKLALHTFVHELVHVDDLRFFARTFPGGWRAAVSRDPRESALLSIVNPCQSEYSASRRSAWLAPELGLDYLDMLGQALKDVDEKIREARQAYRVHGDLDAYWSLVVDRLTFLFQALGYALGHADWVADDETVGPDLRGKYDSKIAALRELPSGWLIDAAREAVQPFRALTEWSGLELYAELTSVAERALNGLGMFTSVREGHLHVDIPLRHWWQL